MAAGAVAAGRIATSSRSRSVERRSLETAASVVRMGSLGDQSGGAESGTACAKERIGADDSLRPCELDAFVPNQFPFRPLDCKTSKPAPA